MGVAEAILQCYVHAPLRVWYARVRAGRRSPPLPVLVRPSPAVGAADWRRFACLVVLRAETHSLPCAASGTNVVTLLLAATCLAPLLRAELKSQLLAACSPSLEPHTQQRGGPMEAAAAAASFWPQ